MEETNNRLHRIVKEEGAAWVDMAAHIDPEDLDLYSERDGLHLSNHGTAVYLTQLDVELSSVMYPRPIGRHPQSFINRLFFQRKLLRQSTSAEKQDGKYPNSLFFRITTC